MVYHGVKLKVINVEKIKTILGKIDIIVHLAAQAGVRYSLENPNSYIQNNIVGFEDIFPL